MLGKVWPEWALLGVIATKRIPGDANGVNQNVCIAGAAVGLAELRHPLSNERFVLLD
jgi:hypothetical protein